MPQIGVDQATGRLTLDGQVLDRNDPRLWGTVGRNVLDASTGDATTMQAGQFDPRYHEAYTINMGDAGEQTAYRLRPEYQQRLGDRIQLSQSGVGGHAEINDPTQATYDPEFGILTGRGNVNAPDDSGVADFLAQYVVPAATIGAIGMGAGGMLGFGPLAEGGALASEGAGSDLLGSILSDGTVGVGPVSSGAEYGATLDLLGGAGTTGIGPVIDGAEYAGSIPGGDIAANVGPGWAEGGGFGAGGLAPEEMGLANYAAGPGLAGAGLSAGQSALQFARDLLTGGGRGGSGGAAGILGGFGAAPRIGDHKQDNDPYGLQASGFGPWQGLIQDDPKAKVAAALTRQSKTNPWG